MHAELMRYILGNHAAARQVPRHHFRFRGGLNLLPSIAAFAFLPFFRQASHDFLFTGSQLCEEEIVSFYDD